MEIYMINLMGNICELLVILFFVKDRYPTKVQKKYLVPICMGLVLFQFMNTNLFLMKSEVILFFSFVFVFGTLLLFKIKLVHQIVFSIFLYVANILSEVIIGMLLSMLLQVDIPVIQNNLILFTISTLSSKFLAYFFVLLLKQKSIKRCFSVGKQNIFLVFTLPLASIMVTLLFLRCCYQINDILFVTITLITTVVLIIANITVFHVMDKQNELIETKEKLIFIEKHINNQAAHYEELYKYQKELREFRHDIKNRLVALIAMINANQNEKALQSMEKDLNFIDEANINIVNSGNPIMDAILQAKLNMAKKQNITLHLFIRFEAEIKINEIELGAILGNALDNAIEAVDNLLEKDNKYINFRLIVTEGRISILIKNPVSEDVDTNNLVTTKLEKKNHGQGLNSIKNIASKYDGIVDFTCENRVFSASINLSNLII